MTIIYMEPGTSATFDLSLWSDFTGTVNSVAGPVHGQVRSQQCLTSNVGDVAYTGIANRLSDHGILSAYLNLDTIPTGLSMMIGLIDLSGGGSFPLQLFLDSNGKWNLLSGFGPISPQFPPASGQVTVGQWTRISIAWNLTSTTVNEIRVYQDGVLIISITNGTLASTGIDSFQIGWQSSGVGNSISSYWSDVYLDDRTDVTDCGDIRVTPKRPASNNVNAFDTAVGASPANRWTNVNERPLSETNGWENTTATTHRENYGIETRAGGDDNLTRAGVRIVGFLGWMWAKSSSASGASITMNGVDTLVNLTTTSAFYFSAGTPVLPSYPSNAAAIGILASGSAVNTFLYEAGVLIAYVPDLVTSTIPGGGYNQSIMRSRLRTW